MRRKIYRHINDDRYSGLLWNLCWTIIDLNEWKMNASEGQVCDVMFRCCSLQISITVWWCSASSHALLQERNISSYLIWQDSLSMFTPLNFYQTIFPGRFLLECLNWNTLKFSTVRNQKRAQGSLRVSPPISHWIRLQCVCDITSFSSRPNQCILIWTTKESL